MAWLSPIGCTLGAVFEAAPAAVQAAHRAGPIAVFVGRACVDPVSPLAGFIARALGLPDAGESVPVEVTFQALPNGRQIWRRRFRNRVFQTEFRMLGPGLCAERYGPLSVELALTIDARGVREEIVGVRLWNIRLPRLFAPCGLGWEGHDSAGRYTFDAEVTLPLIGRLVHYAGYLEPVSAPTFAE